MNWSVPKIWEHKAVAILASGSSMNREVAESVRGLPTIVINSTWELAPWADLLYAADALWWSTSPEAFEFKGIKVSTDAVAQQDPNSWQAKMLSSFGVYLLKDWGLSGFNPDPRGVVTGGNGLYASIHLAAQAGATTAMLFGADMGGRHWHKAHVKPLHNPTTETFARWCKRFETLKEGLSGKMEVWNCTPCSALQCFPHREFQDMLYGN